MQKTDVVYVYIKSPPDQFGEKTKVFLSYENAKKRLDFDKLNFVKWAYEEYCDSNHENLFFDYEPNFEQNYDDILEIMKDLEILPIVPKFDIFESSIFN